MGWLDSVFFSQNFFFLIGILLVYPILIVETVKPKFLWGVVNATLLERKIPKYCTKIIFYNNSTLADAEIGGNYSGVIGNIFIDVHSTFESGEFGLDWTEAEKEVEKGQKLLIEDKLEPCLVVASFVFNSLQYEEKFKKNDTLKRLLRYHLVDLFQFSTPLRNRHLILLRISEEFNICLKGPRYPTRLVPHWEMILFDFFHEARAIQGLFHDEDEPYLRVSKETGKVKWLCDDILERLENERLCKLNATCILNNPKIGQWDPRRSQTTTQPCKLGFRPRQ